MQIPATSAGNSRNPVLIAYNKNMVYFVIPVILTVYFEIFGQAVMYRLKKNPVLFSFPAGFIVWLAFAYLSTGILTAANCLFRTILIIYGLFFLATLLFMAGILLPLPRLIRVAMNAAAALLALLLCPDAAVESAREGLSLCAEMLVPSLFPFFDRTCHGYTD